MSYGTLTHDCWKTTIVMKNWIVITVHGNTKPFTFCIRLVKLPLLFGIIRGSENILKSSYNLFIWQHLVWYSIAIDLSRSMCTFFRPTLPTEGCVTVDTKV